MTETDFPHLNWNSLKYSSLEFDQDIELGVKLSNMGWCVAFRGTYRIIHEINTEGVDKSSLSMDHPDMNVSVGHHGLVPLLELNPGHVLVRLHPELGEHLRQGHLHLRHCKSLTCG